MDFTGIDGSWELADRLNKAGAVADWWFDLLPEEQGDLVDWRASSAVLVVLDSGLAVEFVGGEWVPVAGPEMYAHSVRDEEAVVCLDYRLLWTETPWGLWRRTYDTARDARTAYVYVVSALTHGTQRLTGLRHWLDAEAPAGR